MTRRKKYLFAAAALFLAVALPVFCAAAAFDGRPARPKTDGIIVPVMIYHKVKYNHLSQLVIAPYEFESDLAYIRSAGYTTVTIEDLIRYTQNKGELPEKPIVLSFDDGYLNTYRYAYPLLRTYHMRAVLSVIGKDTDDFTSAHIDDLDYAHMNWEQVAELKNSGIFELQNHSYALHAVTRKRYGCLKNPGESAEHYEEVLTEDLTRMQNEMREKTGVTPTAFTYPYGKISGESVPLLKKMGFQATLTCDYGINVITRNPECLYGLKRIARYHNVPLKKALAEGLKTL